MDNYEKNCCNCKYTDLEPYEAPCKDCSGTVTFDSPLYDEREYLWESGETSDNVNHPSHYNQGGIECIDAMVAAFGKEAVENFCICNAFKYVWRNRDKNGFEDIDKAIWYLNKIKELCSDE